MGVSQKKTSQQSTQNQQTNLTTTPTNPPWVDSGLGGVGDYLTKLGQADPYSFIAGPDALQTQAAGAAGGLTTSPLYTDAAGLFRSAGAMGPNTYNPVTGAASGYTPATAASTSYNPVTGKASGYTAQTGNATSYNAQTGNATTYDPRTYAATTGSASLTGDVPQVQAASLLDNLPAYMSPYTEDVVKSALADYDFGAGQNEGQAKLDLAGDSTFGGSGGAIGLASLREGQSRGRGTLSAGLRDQAFTTGANLSNLDAGRRQSASSENASSALQRALADMQAKNTFGLANIDALNTAGRFNADAENTAGQVNAGAKNTFGLANLDAVNSASRDNANAANNFGLANMDAVNLAARTNADNERGMSLANLAALNESARFGAANEQQTRLANQIAANDAGSRNADNQQQMTLANVGALNEGGRFNAAAGDAAAARQIAAGSALGSLGSQVGADQRANIDTQSQIGAILQALAQQKAGAPLAFGQGLASLWNTLPLDLLHGTNANGTMSGTSTGTGKESGATLGDWLNYFASNARAAASAGGGG